MAIEDWNFAPVTGFERSFDRMRREMDDMFQRFGNTGAARGTFPATNIYDTGDEIFVAVEAPGVKRDQIKVELRERVLTLTGARHEEDVQGSTLLRDERPVGEFIRAFSIPAQIQSDKIKAQFKDGILTIQLPKSEESKPKNIAIEA